MRVTRENVQQLMEMSETLVEQLQSASEAAETWNDLQNEDRNEEVNEQIREAREELDGALADIDASSLCQLIHGKHK